MRIAVLGTGAVGRTLGSKLVELGHRVRMGSRSPGSRQAPDRRGEPARRLRRLPPTLTVCNTDSLGEQIQRAFPEARVVKGPTR